jgi:DNA polymerase III delta prime subunit
MSASVPITFARGPVIFDGGDAAVVVKLPTYAYSHLPDGVKWGLCHAIGDLVQRVEEDISIYRVQRRWPAEDYVARAEALLDRKTQRDPEAWTEFLRTHEPRIARLNAYRPEVYLRVSQRKPETHGTLRVALDRAYRRATTSVDLGPEAPVMERELDLRMEDAARTLDRVCENLPGATPMTTTELEWLCLRAPVRHAAEPFTDPSWEPTAIIPVPQGDGDELEFVPCDSDYLRLFNAPVTRMRDYVIVDGTDADGRTVRTYQTFLTLGALPYRVDFPGDGAEFMFAPLDGLPFPVDAVFHGAYVDNRKAISEVDKAIVDAENRIEEEAGGGVQPDNRALENPASLQALKEELLGHDRPPLVKGGVTYAISLQELQGPGLTTEQSCEATCRELDRRVDALRGRFPDVKLHRPPGLQEMLYWDTLLRPQGGKVTDYRERMRKVQVGMLMPVAGGDIGSTHGPYIGYTVGGRGGRVGTPVLFNFLETAQDDETPSLLFMGREGSGKTLTALYVAAMAALRGSPVFTMDPGEDHYIVDFPGLQDDSQTIGLEASERFRGMLDPLVAVPPELAEDFAIGYLLDLLPTEHRDRGRWEIEVHRAVNHVVAQGHGGMLAVLTHLRAGNEYAQGVADALELFSESGIGILGFSDGTRSANLADVKRVTTITMGNLTLPDIDVPRADYDRSDRLATATYKLVGGLMMGLVKGSPRHVHKFVVLDEAWRWTKTKDGRHRLNELLRLARKLNCTVIVISQGVGDLGDLLKRFGSHFLFGLNDVSEARDGLALIGCDPDDMGLAGRLANKKDFRRGRCLMRDSAGRVEEVQIDVSDEILAVLNTTPRERQGRQGVAA